MSDTLTLCKKKKEKREPFIPNLHLWEKAVRRHETN